jgi:hypothetical protein
MRRSSHSDLKIANFDVLFTETALFNSIRGFIDPM